MYQLTAYEIREKFLAGELSAKEIADYFLKRVKTYEPQLNSFLAILEERIINQALNLDKKRKEKKTLGKLAAIPIAIKDNMHIKGEFTTCGSKFLSNYRALFNATIIDLMEKQDALFLGKTNLDEFAMGSSTEHSAYKNTSNPWNLACTPGGSSGGSAAAVAARLVPLATGSDTGGSVRQPASMCGIVGYKPTYGRVSRFGLVAFGSSLDQIGPLAHNVKDIALTMEVIGHPCFHDATSLQIPKENYLDKLSLSCKNIRIGIPTHFIEQIPSNLYKNFQQSMETFKDLGAEIVDIDLDVLKFSISVFYILATAEASTNLARFDGIRYGIRSKQAKTLEDIYNLSREEGFGPEVKQRIMLGTYVLSAGYHDAYYTKAQKVRQMIINAYEKVFANCDFVAMPTCPAPAFKLDEIQNPLQMYMQDLFTVNANLAGLPAISLPSGFSEDKKPLGIQLIGPQLHDVNVIRYAYAYEQATQFTKNLPPLFDKECE